MSRKAADRESMRKCRIQVCWKAALFFLCVLASAPAYSLKVEFFQIGAQGRAFKPAAAAPGQKPNGIPVASGRLWVKFNPTLPASQRTSVIASLGFSVAKDYPNLGWTLISLSPSVSVADGFNLIRGKPGILSVDIDRAYKANSTPTPNDPLFSSQYPLSQIDAPGGWQYETGQTSTVTIAMIDTGIDGTGQADLDGKLLNQGGFESQFCDPDATGSPCASDSPPVYACNHATRTSGVAAAQTNNGLDIAGVSWGAKLLSLRVFNPTDCTIDCGDVNSFCGVLGGCCSTDDAAIVNAIEYAVSLATNPAVGGRVVINMSLGASGTPCVSTDGSTTTTAMADAIALSTATGIPLAISAGNDGSSVNAPANCAGTTNSGGVIPVGADDQNNQIAYFSSNGPELASNGVVAPGVNDVTTDVSSQTTNAASGTSFSAPHVAGLMALLLSAHSTATPSQVQSWIRGGADNIGAEANYQGSGRINVFKSLRLAQNGTLATFSGQTKAIAFPNPFHPNQGELSFSIPGAIAGSNPTIKIYTIAGQLVNTITGLTWDGRNSGGQMVASGTYIFLVTTGSGDTKGRFSVIR